MQLNASLGWVKVWRRMEVLATSPCDSIQRFSGGHLTRRIQWGRTTRESQSVKKKKSQGGGEKKTNRRQNRWVWGGHAAWASFASWFTWLEALWWLLLRLLLGFTRCYGSASAASIAAVLTVLPWCAFAGAWSAVWARVLAVSVALALGRGRLGCARTTVRFLDSGHLCV